MIIEIVKDQGIEMSKLYSWKERTRIMFLKKFPNFKDGNFFIINYSNYMVCFEIKKFLIVRAYTEIKPVFKISKKTNKKLPITKLEKKKYPKFFNISESREHNSKILWCGKDVKQYFMKKLLEVLDE